MLNVVIVNAPTKRSTVQAFIRSRGIKDFQLVTDASELFQYLMTGTCNVHVFDFYLDMSIINTISDMKESINRLNIYVPDSRVGKPYLTLTDNVAVMPSEVDFLSWFWDQNACALTNVLQCEAAGKPFFMFDLPQKPINPDLMLLYIRPKKIKARYANSSGKIINAKVQQLGVSAYMKGKPIQPTLATRRQAGIFSDEHRVLDLPQPIEEEEVHPIVKEPKPKKEKKVKPPKPPKQPKAPKPPKPEKPKKEPRPTVIKEPAPEYDETPVDVVDMEQVHGKFSEVEAQQAERAKIDMSELEALTSSQEEQVSEQVEEPVEEPEVEPVENTAQESADGPEAEAESEPEPEPEPEPARRKRPKVEINMDSAEGEVQKITPHSSKMGGLNLNRIKVSTASTIEDYMVQNGYIDQITCNQLLKEVRDAKAMGKNIRIGDLAVQKGYIELEDLVKITAKVFRMEIIGWSQLESMKVDYSDFTPERCRELKFFRTEDDAQGNVQIIVSASAMTLDNAIKRLYDNPRIRYTLDEYIERKLEM